MDYPEKFKENLLNAIEDSRVSVYLQHYTPNNVANLGRLLEDYINVGRFTPSQILKYLAHGNIPALKAAAEHGKAVEDLYKAWHNMAHRPEPGTPWAEQVEKERQNTAALNTDGNAPKL